MKIKATKRWFNIKYVNGQEGKILAYNREDAIQKAFKKLSPIEQKELIDKHKSKEK